MTILRLYVYIYSKDNVLLPEPNQCCITIVDFYLMKTMIHDLGLVALKGGLTSQQFMKCPSSQKQVYVKRDKVIKYYPEFRSQVRLYLSSKGSF